MVCACWLNSYRPSEVAWWWASGVQTWRELSRHPSDSVAWAVHAGRREQWPHQCRPALRLLKDKAALLTLAPAPWRSPFLVLTATTPPAPSDNEGPPAWWEKVLRGEGVVLKPLQGHGGRAVIRFRFTASGLEAQPLFSRLPSPHPPLATATPPPPWQLLALWRHLCRTQDSALAAPYLTHSAALPATDPSVVVRLITARAAPEAPLAVRQAWLEVPLAEGMVAFLTLDGQCLPQPGHSLDPRLQQRLEGWQARLQAGVPPCVAACLDAALALHALLPPMDQVAWDWIPADPHPRLLEGNGGFGLLVPQLLAHRSLAPPRDA
ncbi:MAG: hypothetical protein VKM68_06455 [Cyanobacteriota bacterium]|nr:hypothetical protein [Cyanobacteriota bacterium]